MKTAVDMNVFLDILTDDLEDGEASQAALRESVAAGLVVACPVVIAETVAWFPSAASARDSLRDAGVSEDASGWPCLGEAARAWQTYTKNRSRADLPELWPGSHGLVPNRRDAAAAVSTSRLTF